MRNWRYTSMLCQSEDGDALRGCDQARLVIYLKGCECANLEAVSEQVGSFTWRTMIITT